MGPIRTGDRLWVSLIYIYNNEFINDRCSDKIETGVLFIFIFKKYFVIHPELLNLIPISSHIEQQHLFYNMWKYLCNISTKFSLKVAKGFIFFICTATSPSLALNDILYLAFEVVLTWNYIYIYNWFRNCCDYTVLITGITFMTDICICYGFILNSRYGSLFMDFLGFPYQHIWILRVWGVFFLPIWNQSYLPVTQETPQI